MIDSDMKSAIFLFKIKTKLLKVVHIIQAFTVNGQRAVHTMYSIIP